MGLGYVGTLADGWRVVKTLSGMVEFWLTASM